MAQLATFSALGLVLGRRLLSGLLLALLAAAACVVLATAELRFEGGNPGLEGFILVILSLQDLEGSRRFVVILNPDKLGFG